VVATSTGGRITDRLWRESPVCMLLRPSTRHHDVVFCLQVLVLNVHVRYGLGLANVFRARIFMSRENDTPFSPSDTIRTRLSHLATRYRWLATLSAVTSAPVSIVGVARPL
jgi:hypothetical protein